MFNSSQDKLKDFLLELQAKMMMNADHYSLSQNKLWYTITWVTGKVKDQILLYYIDNTVNLTDLTAFEELMQKLRLQHLSRRVQPSRQLYTLKWEG